MKEPTTESSLSTNRLGSKDGPLDAGADQGQGAAPGQLVEAGLHGRLLARALEHNVEGGFSESLRLPGWEALQVVRLPHLGGAKVRCQLAAPLPRLDGHDIRDSQGPQGGDGQGADGAGADDENPITGLRPRAGDPVQGHGQWLGQRRVTVAHALRASGPVRLPALGCSRQRHRH